MAQCKQYVVQIPCEAEAGLHKLRTKLEGSTVRGLAQPLNQALDDLQVCTREQTQIICMCPAPGHMAVVLSDMAVSLCQVKNW